MTGLVQLAADFRGVMPTGGMLAEPKRDGWRAARFPGVDGVTRLWTRNGMPLDGCDDILSRLAQMERAAGTPMFFDGEIQIGGTLAATKAWCEREWKLGQGVPSFYAFDCLPLTEWKRGGTDRPLYQRKAMLAELYRATEEIGDGWTWSEGSKGAETPVPVQIVPDVWISDPADAVAEMWRTVGPAFDGVMLKDAESPYRRNRNAAWQKVKPENMHHWSRRLAA